MWNAHDKPVQTHGQLKRYNLDLLRDFASEPEEDIPAEIYAALEFLEKESTRELGFRLYRQGLEERNHNKLVEGIKKISEHLGM